MSEELKYQIALTLIPGVGDVLAKNLVSYCGSAEAVFKEKQQKLMRIPDIGPVTAKAIVNYHSKEVFSRVEQEINFIEKHKIVPLFYTHRDYPRRLKNCNDAPVLLYYKGSSDLNAGKMLGIVGTRNMTGYGKKICEKIIEELAEQKITVISGLAYGVDICAHKASLKQGCPTLGVLAHGLDRIYPSSHRSTAEKMLTQGGLITEFLSQTNPDKENFPSRNRIIAGMADAVIVIESADKGGSLITAEIANLYNRDVFAIPGRVDDEYSAGCNRLIKTNKAALVESAKDIEYLMGWEKKEDKKSRSSVQKQLFPDLQPDEKIVCDLLTEKGNLDIDSLCHFSKFTMSKAASVLLTF